METAYREYRNLLLFLAARKFRVPADDAEALLHDVFISFISRGSDVRDRRAWLVSAMCNASRAYLSRRMRDAKADEVANVPCGMDADRIDRMLQIRQVISALPARDRELLQLRYVNGLSASEIADKLNLGSVGYAYKVLSIALGRARASCRGELPLRSQVKEIGRPTLPTRSQLLFPANGLPLEMIAEETRLTTHLAPVAKNRDVAAAGEVTRKRTGRLVCLSDSFDGVHVPFSEAVASVLRGDVTPELPTHTPSEV